MFEENENLVTDEVTENVEEQATEELVDGAKEETTEVVEETPVAEETFTKKQVDEMIAKKLARKEAKIRKDFERKYGRLENVLKAGTGVETVDEMADTFTDFYTKRGIQIPQTAQYSEREAQILAEAEANEIITAGYDEIADELNRLTDIGFDNMTATDKHIFMKLKKEADRISSEKELKSIGITELPDGFKEFADKLNPELSMKEKYELYTKMNPKKEIKTIGSMQSGQESKVKESYTKEEIERMTEEDLDKPGVWEAVRRSMTGM